MKLGESTQFYKNETEKWKTKSENLEGDRKFLEDQLKKIKKKIKSLQLEKEQDKDSNDSFRTSAFRTFDILNLNFSPSTKTGEMIFKLIQKNSLQIDDFLYDLESNFHTIEIKYNESIKHLKKSLELEKKKNRTILAQQASVYLTKNDMESLFLECVEEVRKDINKRRAYSTAAQKFPKRANSTHKDDRGFMMSSDKRKILELLVSNEQILVGLYEKLFPYRATHYGNITKLEDKFDDKDIPDLEELLKQVPSKPNTTRLSINQYRGKSIS